MKTKEMIERINNNKMKENRIAEDKHQVHQLNVSPAMSDDEDGVFGGEMRSRKHSIK